MEEKNRSLLSGLKVLDLTRLLPGPFGTCLLADLGADVLKIEEPAGGDYMRGIPPLVKEQSAYFLAINRNKRSLALDLKNEAGRETLVRLLDTYDVLAESFRPGVMAKLGLDYDTLKAKQPRLIYASLSGYGQAGPYSQRAGHDLNYLAIAGGAGLTGTHEGQLAIAGHQLADFSGGLYMALAILAAALGRQQTGEGAFIDVAMTDCARAFQLVPFIDFWQTGQIPGPAGHIFAGRYVCYSLYPTSDNRFMSLCALEPKFWQQFCHAMEKDHLLDQAFAPAHPDHPVKRELDLQFIKHSQVEWTAFFSQYDCCCEPVLDVAQAAAHPQAAEREAVREVEHPTEGKYKEMTPPLLFSPPTKAEPRPAPQLGEHTAEVLGEIGLTRDAIEKLKERGAFGAFNPL